MKFIKPGLPESSTINSQEDLYAIIATLAYHLAVEMDMRYEDEEAELVADMNEALIAATAVLLMGGYIAPSVVHHTIERFYLPLEE
jgi:3-dehydroquinate dehydratase